MKWYQKKANLIITAVGIVAIIIAAFVAAGSANRAKTAAFTATSSDAMVPDTAADGTTAPDAAEEEDAKPRTGWAVRFGSQVYYDQGKTVTDQWVGDYYLGENGVLVKNAFIVYHGMMFHVGQSGACDRGRFYDGDREYCANEDGVLYASNWIMDGENWIYVDESGLVLKNDITPDGYLMDAEGRIIDDGYSEYEEFRYSDKSLRLNIGAADLIWKYLKKENWTDTAIAGVLGNFQQESHLSPSLVESNGIGYGLGQWSFARRTALETYAAGLGKPVNDMYMQLDYLMVESGEHSFVSHYSKTNFSSAAEAAINWCTNWERPDKRKARLGEVRIPYAMAYYEHYVNGVDYMTTAYAYEDPVYLEEEILEESQKLGTTGEEYTPLTDAQGNPTLGWIHDAKGWWYRYADGGYPQEQWDNIYGEWYYFGSDGYMVSGRWITDEDGHNYELDQDGHIVPPPTTEAETAAVIMAGETATASDAVSGDAVNGQ